MKDFVREAVDKDKDSFIDFVVKLSAFNRRNHGDICKYDDYESVVAAIRERAAETFDKRGKETLILIAELENQPVGYALGRIYSEECFADNGTGQMGLFDELFVDDSARGHGLGQTLLDETMNWFRKNGISRVKLHAYSWNTNAKRMYEKNGFTEYAVSYEKFI